MSEECADVVVAIDFGMTSTGVAYTRRPHKDIRRLGWKEEASKATFKPTTKMPTVLKYDAYSGGRLISWGFQASESSDIVTEGEYFRIAEWFKQYLNSDYLTAACRVSAAYLPQSYSEVRQWYVDYLRELHDKVRVKVQKNEGVYSWEEMRIEFRFTWPTTWTAADIESFRECIIAAGYQNDQRSHWVNLSMSEAQAAALYAAGQIAEKVKDGESVMVCDVGGGTIDIAVVKAVADTTGLVRFELEWNCQGRATGATDIDAALQVFVERRLSLIPDSRLDSARISRNIRESLEWYEYKCHDDGSGSESFSTEGLIDNEAARIRDGCIELTREDLQYIFHGTIARVQRAVLDAMQGYGQPLNHLVGCGGYFHIMRARNAFNETFTSAAQHLNHCSRTKIHIAQDPELAVSNGGCLRISRRSVFEEFSLGLVCGERAFELASTSKLSWIIGNAKTRSGADAYLLDGDAQKSLSVNLCFKHHSPEGGYYYLTLVLMARKQGRDSPEDSDDGGSRSLCQVRLQKRDLASRWAFKGSAKCKPFTLTWMTNHRRIDVGIQHVESKVKIPFEMCEPITKPIVDVHVPPRTKRIGKVQWK